jgi:CHAT domain-containing protein
MTVEKERLEAVAYAVVGNFGRAEASLSVAEQSCSSATYPVCARILAVRGWVELEHGNFGHAQELYEQARALAHSRKDEFQEANALLSLSRAALEQTHFDQALVWSDACTQISITQGFADLSQSALGNMGWAYFKLGDPERAQQMFSEAKKQAAEIPDLINEVRWLNNIGLVDMERGKLNEAQSAFSRALDLANRLGSRGDITNSLVALASVSEQTGKLDEAKRYADKALAMAQEDKNGRDQVYPRLVQGRIAARLHDNATAENTFHEVAKSADTPVFLKWEAERSLARLYEDENQRVSAEKEYRTALSTFETARSELKHEDSRLPFLSNAARIYDDYIHFLVTQGKKDEALQVADYSRGRTLAEGLGVLQKQNSFKPASLDAQAVARRAGGTILFYWLGERQSYLWAITAQKTNLFTLPPGAEIDAAIRRYREALEGPQDVLASADSDGQLLYRMLIAPVWAFLKKDAKVFVIPDGSLNNLNFETLLVPEIKLPDAKLRDQKLATSNLPAPKQSVSVPQPKLHYWIEDVTVASASSLRILGAARTEEKKRDRTLLLIGNSAAPNDKYPQLAQAAAQMQSVAQRFPADEETILTGHAATPSAYLASHPERFSNIHFVAHGTASRLSPLDSAIMLSKDSSADDSFKLYARDIILHPLRAELVTISACYSSGERSYSGEGLVGLSWAFLRAGAHNVIAALWEATDTSTQMLMDKFYDELQKGKSPDAALRAAKLSLLRNSRFRNPFYWAPFQLYARLG